MNLSTWSIHRPVPTIALFLVLCVLGAVSFMRLPVTQFPNVDLPIVTVTVADPGAAPREITDQITKPIEDEISSISGIRHITSTTSDGTTTITVEFELSKDKNDALNSVEDSVATVRSTLPDSITEPVVKRIDVAGRPIVTYAVADPTRTIENLSYFVDNTIARRLQGVDGVGQVSRLGGADREINVELDPDRLLALGITASQVNDQLRATNIDVGSGRGDLAGQEFSIRTLGSVDTVAKLAATPLSLSNGRTVRLDQLGTVTDGSEEPRTFALFDGEPVVAFGIVRETGKSDLDTAEGVKKELASIRKDYPNLRISEIDDSTVSTRNSYDNAMETLYEGAALAVIVVFLFLRDWRATLLTALALPLSVIPTFFVMELLGFSLNTLSLLGITLVTGILVDDAIVEIENIVRHIRMGRRAFEASEEAANEIGLTVIAISFTIVAVFAPVGFMGGIAGEYFKQFGLTVAVAVLFSLLVARLVTPMVAAYFMRDAEKPEKERDGVFMRGYMHVLNWTLRHRFVTLLLGLGIFAGSIYSATLLPTEFMPPIDSGRSAVSVELPPGSTLADTRQATRTITKRLMTMPQVEHVFVDGGTNSIATANLTVDYVDRDKRDLTAKQLEGVIATKLASIPDVRMHVTNADGNRDVQVVVLGDTVEAASKAAEKLAEGMKTLPGVVDPSTSAALTRPEIRITPKPELAAKNGVTASSLASTIRIATIGDTEANMAKFNTGDRRIPIRVSLSDKVRDDLFRMANQRVPTTTGKPLPLGVVADIHFSDGPATIERYDRHSQTKVEADLAPGTPLGPVLEKIHNLPAARNMPNGTSIKNAGDAEIMNEVFSSFALAMGAGIMLVYVVLVLLFASFITPITILLSLPLAIGGAILALYVTDRAISLSVIIGFLMLMGIVTKNAIMLVEFSVQSMHRGSSRLDAMLDAGHKRVRPIVMTTIAMTAGMLPSAISTGTGSEFSAPMAIAVIGGLLVSTLLSLLFVPSLFSAIDAFRERVGRGFARLFARRPAEQPAE
ncbi:efflux RND transporter permease subunit [Pararhizobium mangrovi]|uniref:Efflux RND transporter permease subunit n=1 Tax=Pararhizobium mangrovi TaxID=2590452 RepID=A0A506UEM0_9HYPH|nr:efflux RND transporter permease subunit [Pararhizobium mangrovi]TPW31916.1 efflux RND transporter permease subunit [Pararhizobium mangrovi]